MEGLKGVKGGGQSGDWYGDITSPVAANECKGMWIVSVLSETDFNLRLEAIP